MMPPQPEVPPQPPVPQFPQIVQPPAQVVTNVASVMNPPLQPARPLAAQVAPQKIELPRMQLLPSQPPAEFVRVSATTDTFPAPEKPAMVTPVVPVSEPQVVSPYTPRTDFKRQEMMPPQMAEIPMTTPSFPPAPVKTTEPAPMPERTPQPGFGHASDYSWVMGELEHIQARNVWRVRYAPPEEEDRHGGTVVLMGDALPRDCRAGQIVRVEGQLGNPDSDEPRPPYWVRAVHVLKPGSNAGE
jgi:hypothetical protein